MLRHPAVRFFLWSTIAYALSYLVVGALAYQLLTKQFYVGDDAVFRAYLRSEANPAEWAHTNVWLVPGLLLRATLTAAVLVPFLPTLTRMTFLLRTGAVFALLFVLQHIAAAAPSPSNIEGFIYMKPELVSWKAFLLTQPEMVMQTLLFALSTTWPLGRPRAQDGARVDEPRPAVRMEA